MTDAPWTDDDGADNLTRKIEKHIAHEHANLLVLPGVFFYRSCSGAVGSGPAAVESAAASVVALTCGVAVCCWLLVWMVVRFM